MINLFTINHLTVYLLFAMIATLIFFLSTVMFVYCQVDFMIRKEILVFPSLCRYSSFDFVG